MQIIIILTKLCKMTIFNIDNLNKNDLTMVTILKSYRSPSTLALSSFH